MGIEAHYAIVSEPELQKILDGNSKKVLDALRGEYSALMKARICNMKDALVFGIKEAISRGDVPKSDAFDPSDPESVSRFESKFDETMEQLKEEQPFMRQFLEPGDPLEDLLWLYVDGSPVWKPQAEKLGFSEASLINELNKRGLHFWLDLDKRWESMHAFLTGVSLSKQRDLTALSKAMQFIEAAKENDDFPMESVKIIAESMNEVDSMLDEYYLVERHLYAEIRKFVSENDERPEDLERQSAILRNSLSGIWRVPDEISTCLFRIAAMQQDMEIERIKRSHTLLLESAKCVGSIQSLMKTFVTNMRARQLTKADEDTASEISTHTHRLSQLGIEIGWGSNSPRGVMRYYSEELITDLSLSSLSDKDLLSLSVSGGRALPEEGSKYLTVRQVAAIARVLEALPDEWTGAVENEFKDKNSDFESLKIFYLRAAALQGAVLVFFG